VHAVDLLSDLGRTAPIVAAPVERDWMGRTPAGFAYRRLPLDSRQCAWLADTTVGSESNSAAKGRKVH
jgi:hypothetical protein